MTEYKQKDILRNIHKVIMVGEIKSGADPAGADEHWKTANTALKRVREGYSDNTHRVLTSIIANTITQHMAKEICEQLHSGVLDNTANLNNEEQLVQYCKWIISL
jgi:type II restriction enzyme